MGVKGLWKLLDGTGQPVTLESLEGKVLAIDISLWLNMAIKGMRDVHGHAANDAHLITLFNRICKLLYFGVKPVFVFDGKAPLLKQRTLQDRQERKNAHSKESRVASQKLLQNYLKRQVLNMAIKSNSESGPSTSQPKSIQEIKRAKRDEEEEMYALPPISSDPHLLNSSDEEREEQWMKRSSTREAVYGSAMLGDFRQMMSIDVNSDEFKSLPSDIQHELLSDIKEIRKRRRTQFEKMPDSSKSFSSYQLQGLLAKRDITGRIEQVEKQMQQETTVTMTALGLEGDSCGATIVDAKQLVSDENTRFILLNRLAAKKVKESDTILHSSAPEEKPPAPNLPLEDEGKSKKLDTMSIESSDIRHAHEVPSCEKNSVNSDDDRTNDSGRCLDVQMNQRQEKSTAVLNSKSALMTSTRPSVEGQASDLPAADITLSPSESSATEDEMCETSQTLSVERAASFKDASDVTTQEVPVVQLDQPNDDLVAATLPDVDDNLPSTPQDSDDDFVEVDESDVTEKAVVSTKQEEAVSSTESDFATELEANPWSSLLEVEDISTLQEQIDIEDVALIERMKSSARAARDLSDAATTESQQLLKLFGIPFLVSPQEAESQCAFLDAQGLTMGTITDDSDVLLFGGRVVYKSVFDRKHDPAMYSVNVIKADLGLERSHLINIALCSGSDYTIGIEKVGPVAALEIMKEFPGEGVTSLLEFRRWWDEAHKQLRAPPAETTIKTRLRKLHLPDGFPSQFVVDAYLKPIVNESTKTFTWGIPDLDAIRNFLIERLKWTKNKVDETLLPVLKRASERSKNQTVLTDYFVGSGPVSKKRFKKSKRLNRALFGISKSEHCESPAKKIHRKRTKKIAANKVPPKRAVANQNKLGLSESSSSDSS